MIKKGTKKKGRRQRKIGLDSAYKQEEKRVKKKKGDTGKRNELENGREQVR